MVIERAAPGDQRLRGRVGIITGAASGIGATGADLFAAHGAALVLLDQDPAGGQRVADAITARHGRAVFLSGDAASAEDVTRAVRTATERFGKLDLLWANAGTGVAKTVPQTTLEEWNRVLAVNLTGAFLLAKYGIPELAAGGGGTMVITGSANSFAADRSWAATTPLPRSLPPPTIRSTSSAPARSPPRCTRMAARPPGGRPLPEVGEDRAAHPLGRFATREVARAALFLSSAESSFTTGSRCW